MLRVSSVRIRRGKVHYRIIFKAETIPNSAVLLNFDNRRGLQKVLGKFALSFNSTFREFLTPLCAYQPCAAKSDLL